MHPQMTLALLFFITTTTLIYACRHKTDKSKKNPSVKFETPDSVNEKKTDSSEFVDKSKDSPHSGKKKHSTSSGEDSKNNHSMNSGEDSKNKHSLDSKEDDNKNHSSDSDDPNAKSNHPLNSDKIDSNLNHTLGKSNLSLYSEESIYSPDSNEYKTYYNKIKVIASLNLLKQNISFVAEIRNKSNYPFCAGSVISKRHVLSLNPCDGEKPLSTLQIVVGLVFNKYDIENKIAQKSIALFQTFRIIEVGWKMKVPKKVQTDAMDLTVYRLTSMAFPSSTVSVINTKLCKTYFEKFTQLNKLCFAGVPCTTFNGLPVVNRDNEIVGITAANDVKGWIKCKNGQTTMGVDVSKYSNWIETQIRPYKL